MAKPDDATRLLHIFETKEHTLSLTHGQRYILRELRLLFGATSDDNLKAQINILERVFRSTLTRAVAQELNKLRRNAVTGQNLFKSLSEIYYRHNMLDWLDSRGLRIEEKPVPRIICSEALV